MSRNTLASIHTLAARGSIERRQAFVKIGISSPFAHEEVIYGEPIAQVPIRTYRAIIDTGAQRSCLSRPTIAAEKLTWHGKKALTNVHDTNIHYLFWANVGIWCERGEVSVGQESNTTYFALPEPVEVFDIAPSHWFDAIIGMDIIRRCRLSTDEHGFFELTLKF